MSITTYLKDIERSTEISASRIIETNARSEERTNKVLKQINIDTNKEIGNVSKGIYQLNSDFNMAMGSVTLKLDMQRMEMRQGLQNIVDTLKNVRKTDALEDFNDAIEFYNDGIKFQKPIWFQKAHKYFVESIKKYERNPIAYLYLGHIYHYNEEFRDFDKALQYYEFCYTYGEANEQNNAIAAQGYFYAGWLKASVYNDLDIATELINNALRLSPDLSMAHYNLARIYSLNNNRENAVKHLRYIIENIDRNYISKAETDVDFNNMKKDLNLLLEDLKEKSREDALETYGEITRKVNAYKLGVNIHEIIKEELLPINIVLVKDTYFGYLDALENYYLFNKNIMISLECIKDIDKILLNIDDRYKVEGIKTEKMLNEVQELKEKVAILNIKDFSQVKKIFNVVKEYENNLPLKIEKDIMMRKVYEDMQKRLDELAEEANMLTKQVDEMIEREFGDLEDYEEEEKKERSMLSSFFARLIK